MILIISYQPKAPQPRILILGQRCAIHRVVPYAASASLILFSSACSLRQR